MKNLLFALPLLMSMPVHAQQIETGLCRQYRPAYYDRYGNYVHGEAVVESYSVSCGGSAPPRAYRTCRPSQTFLGALLGGGVAASMSRGNGYAWSVPVGAAVGGYLFGCN
jgi:hypothetical protein